MARIYQQLQQLEPAHQALSNGLKINPSHEETLKLKIKLLEQEHRYEQAVGCLQKLIETSRSPLKYRDLMADFLMKMGHYPEAIAELESLIALDPSSRIHYRGKMGQAYFDQSQYGQAIEYFKLVLQEQNDTKDVEYIQSVKSQMAAALCNEGVKRYEIGDFGGAIERYQEALLYDDSNADIHYNLGKALIRTQESAKAIRHFEQALTISPQDASCYYELAVLQDEKGMIPEALANYEKVLQLEPNNALAYFGIGTLYGVEGSLEKSIRFLSDAIRINPNYVDAFYNLGVALERKRDTNKAIKMYKKVISLDRNHDKAKSNLAHIQHTKQGSAK
jgi:tetratricopeptide (TPR) repeat protein